MDHADRHLSSPSPTSSFSTHHGKASYDYSSDLLGPLLSSGTDDSEINACFSTTAMESGTICNISPKQNNDDTHILTQRQQTETDQVLSETSTQIKENALARTNFTLREFNTDESSATDNRQVELNIGQSSSDSKLNVDMDDDDDDDDDDEDENMRNMLSGSSRSSTTTIPLLTDAHTHHSFSERISLGEYSPLSLVNDCDNALPMSPTSLTCGSHHSSFKSSLNNLKIDHLGVDGVSDVGVHGVDDVVGDTRSMSPSLLSNPGSHHNQNNLWSNSSTAITQNPSLLTSTSTSILLSQHSHHPSQHSHHNHQINTLMQQLEPQSLDEPPPLMGNSRVSTLDADLNASQQSQILLHRPSSEPPLNSDINNINIKNLNGFASASNSDSPACRVKKQTGALASPPGISESTYSTSLATGSSSSACTTSGRLSSSKNRSVRSRARNNRMSLVDSGKSDVVSGTQTIQPQTSKFYLQLNHHKKLKELQQRLFGNVASTSNSIGDETKDLIHSNEEKSCLDLAAHEPKSPEANIKPQYDSREEADSSANRDAVPTTPNTNSDHSDAAHNHSKSVVTKKNRQTNKRKRNSKNQTNKNSPDPSPNSDSSQANCSGSKPVKTETAEPDTTTKSADCLKLADLLASSNSVDLGRASGAITFALGSDTVNRLSNGDDSGDNGERKIQHIQMNPSLTVVANNNGLIQPINIQHQLQLINNEIAITANSNNIGNQIIRQCQPNSTVTSLAGNDSDGSSVGTQFRCNIISNSDSNLDNGNNSSKGNNEEKNWTNNSHNINGNEASTNIINKSSSAPSTTTIGAHQIAIQVICQDGTSLVLPVSPASGLNTAVAFSAQTQTQLQAILSNNGNNSVLFTNYQQSQQFNGTQQVFPVVKMINTQSHANNVNASNSVNSEPNQSTANTGSTSSGLAASSPTLAALLDAGSNRGSTLINSFKNNGSNENGKNKVNHDWSKVTKMTLSTGNRQVDPAQPFRCEHCNSTFTRLGNFTRHKKIHTVPTKDGQRFKCDVCSKSFLQRCDLARHLHIHRGTEPHRCNICGKGYIRHSDLVTHQRFHNKEKPFGCPHCSKGFCQRGDLNRHLRSIHLQMKPILCPCCNRKFAKQETLLRHLNTAHRGNKSAGGSF